MGSFEIYETYHDLPESEAFEVFEANDVDSDIVAGLLGDSVAKSYEQWIYLTQC